MLIHGFSRSPLSRLTNFMVWTKIWSLKYHEDKTWSSWALVEKNQKEILMQSIHFFPLVFVLQFNQWNLACRCCLGFSLICRDDPSIFWITNLFLHIFRIQRTDEAKDTNFNDLFTSSRQLLFVSGDFVVWFMIRNYNDYHSSLEMILGIFHSRP